MPGSRRTAAILGAAVPAAAAAGVVWWDRRDDHSEPWDPEAPRFPDGKHHRVTTDDGVELAVTVAGPDDGPTVVLSHCWTGSRGVWGPVAERLVADDHRVVLYDQRGHGESTHSTDPPSMAMLGHDLRAVLDAVDADDVVLGGHSMGGMSIQSYAAEHPVHFTERVRALVLVATAARTLGRPIPHTALDRVLGDRYPSWAARGVLGRAIVRRSIGRSPRRAHVELTLDGWARTTGYARAGFLASMAGMDLRGALSTAEVPATVVVGSRDRLTPVRAARALAADVADSELVVLPDAGHMLPLEAPDELADVLRRHAAATS